MKNISGGLLALVGLMAATQPAFAQSTSSTEAQAANTVNVTAVSTGPQGPQHTDVDYSGHTWTTPVVSGSYFGGTNPCLVGTGGGAAGGPIGFSINLGRSDEACTRRSDAAAWHAMGFDNIAVARMCQDEKNADAFFSATGFACPGSDRKRYTLASGEPAPVAVLYNNGPSGADLPQYRPPMPLQQRTSMVEPPRPAQVAQASQTRQAPPTVQQTHHGQSIDSEATREAANQP